MREYTLNQRLKAGFKRCWKYAIVVAPVLIEYFTAYEVPYKEEALIILVAVMTLEKTMQKAK